MSVTSREPTVFVVGSISADLTAFSPQRPAPGETLRGDRFSLALGGKGANQAIAAARAGARVQLIGCVGDDLFRNLVLSGLTEAGVDTKGVSVRSGATGIAHIRVDSGSAENDIVIVPGANDELDPDHVEQRLRESAQPGDVLLLQLEINWAATLRAAQVGSGLGMRVVLDPAPAGPLPQQIWPMLEVVTPNESEAAALSGVDVAGADGAGDALRWFVDRGVQHPIVTLGGQGSIGWWDGAPQQVAAVSIEPVDTTASGDAFTGALAAALAAGATVDDAVRRGSAAGAYAATVVRASPSLPTAAQVDRLLARR